jgi:hypothetical protein
MNYAAVVSPFEHEHSLAFRPKRKRRDKRHQICLGAGIGEPHELNRCKARTDRLRKVRLVLIRAAEYHALRERVANRPLNDRMRVAVQSGRIFTEKIEIFDAIEVSQPLALAARKSHRERAVMEHASRVAARHVGCRAVVSALALRAARAKPCLGESKLMREFIAPRNNVNCHGLCLRSPRTAQDGQSAYPAGEHSTVAAQYRRLCCGLCRPHAALAHIGAAVTCHRLIPGRL